MNSVRTSSLFHYTNYQSLCKIIQEGLIPNYCREDLTFENENRQFGSNLGIPMVSFCDIPLSRIGEFSARYGHCAIGLDKKWANSNPINPIIYAKDLGILQAYYYIKLMLNSICTVKLSDREHYINNKRVKELDVSNFQKAKFFEKYGVIPLFGFVKKYQSFRDNNASKLQNNYLENEWRYVVPESEEIKWYWDDDEYKKWRGDKKTPKPLPGKELKDKKLSFNVNDISFIIVDKESQVNKMIIFLSEVDYIGGKKLENKDKDDSRRKLMSRIISLERIISDF